MKCLQCAKDGAQVDRLTKWEFKGRFHFGVFCPPPASCRREWWEARRQAAENREAYDPFRRR